MNKKSVTCLVGTSLVLAIIISIGVASPSIFRRNVKAAVEKNNFQLSPSVKNLTSPSRAIINPANESHGMMNDVAMNANSPSSIDSNSLNKNLSLLAMNSLLNSGEMKQKRGPAPKINYTVEVKETENGLAISLNKGQLWQTDWASTILDAKPSFAMRNNKIIGVQLGQVKKDSLVEAVGLRAGDTLKSINGEALDNPLTLPSRLLRGIGGKRAQIVVERENSEIILDASSVGQAEEVIDIEQKMALKETFKEFKQAANVLDESAKLMPANNSTSKSELHDAKKQLEIAREAVPGNNEVLNAIITGTEQLIGTHH